MALQVPPPSRWQGEETGGVWSAQQTGSALSAAHQIAGTESANAAWKHVKAVLMDDGKPADLYDLLLQSGSENIEPMPTGVSGHTLRFFGRAYCKSSHRELDIQAALASSDQ